MRRVTLALLCVLVLVAPTPALADGDEEQVLTASVDDSGGVSLNTGTAPDYPIAEVTCRIRLRWASGGGRIEYSGRDLCDALMSYLSGRARIEHRGEVVSLGNAFSCFPCYSGLSQGEYGGAVAGYTYHYLYTSTLVLRSGFYWAYVPVECFITGRASVDCGFHRAFNARP